MAPLMDRSAPVHRSQRVIDRQPIIGVMRGSNRLAQVCSPRSVIPNMAPERLDGGLTSSSDSSPVTPGQGPSPGPQTGAAAMVERACLGATQKQLKPGHYEDQHAGN